MTFSKSSLVAGVSSRIWDESLRNAFQFQPVFSALVLKLPCTVCKLQLPCPSMNGPYFPVYLELFHFRILNLHFKHPLIQTFIKGKYENILFIQLKLQKRLKKRVQAAHD